MAIPLLGRRRERRDAQTAATIEAAVEKALSPAIAAAGAAMSSGATYPVLNQSSPFNQTAGNYAGVSPLPRPPGQFDSLFGPGAPLWPDSLDPLGPNGRSQLRRSEYPVTWNVQLLDRPIPWTVLTHVAMTVDVVNKCIAIKQDELCGYEWDFGFSKQILQQIMAESGETNTARATALARDKYGDELTRVQEFFQMPDERMGFTFRQWLAEALFNILTYDAWVCYPEYNLGGELRSLSNIDPTGIKILRDNQGFIPRPPAPAYQQVLWGYPRNETQAEDPDSENVLGEYQRDQLAYFQKRPMPRQVYGFSPVEQVLPLAEIYYQRQQWLAAEYSHGMVPRLLIEVDGTESWTPEQLAYYQTILNDQLTGQIQRRQQALLLRPGMKAEQMKAIDEVFKNEYDNFIIGQIGSRFGVPGTQLGVQAKAGLSGGKQMEGEAQQSQDYSTGALIKFVVECINRMAMRFMGVGSEITAICTQSEGNEEDNLRAAEADASDVGAGIITRNESRAKRGLPLIDEPEADALGITTGTGVQFLAGQIEQQATQAALAAQPPTPTHTVTTAPDGTVTETHGTAPPGHTAASVSGTAASVTTSASVAPKAKTADNGSGGGVTPKDDARQPDTDAEKELRAFSAFAKSRVGKTYRDFEFDHIDASLAARLNEAGRLGDLTVVKSLISATKGTTIIAAGICLKADDTGRVLLVQRSIDNSSRPTTGGQWEWPGGVLDDGDDPLDAAQREFEEEVGVDLPKGKVVGSWTTSTGYQCFVYVIKHEADLELDDARSSLDGSGDDEIENVAWWDPNDLQANPAIRTELQSSDWALIGSAKKAARVPPEAAVVPSNVIQPLDGGTTALEYVADIVAGRVSGDIARLRETFGLLEMAKAKAPVIQIDNHIPQQPQPVIHVDATSKHTHNVAAPTVNVEPAAVTVNVPPIKIPKAAPVTVNVPPPASSTIRRDADGNIVVERSND